MFGFFKKKRLISLVPLLFNEKEDYLLNPIYKEHLYISTCYEIFDIFWTHWNNTLEEREEYMILFLRFCEKSRKTQVLGLALEGIGTKNKVITNMGRIVDRAKLVGATAIATAHNHTTQNIKPSKSDLLSHMDLRDFAFKKGIEFVEHIILTPTKNDFFSFVESRIF